MKFARSILLLLISILVGLLLCEAALRLFTPYGRPRPMVATQGSNKALDTNGAMPYVARIATAPGTDRRWFAEDPPPLPNRSKTPPELAARYHDYESRGIFPPQAAYIWNRYFLESERCRSDGMFHRYPATVLGFDPPVADMHPRYRFPPDTTTFEGLVLNHFGLRGPPLALVKPPRTIRIAFAGASTTINHELQFAYPERVVYWLNRYAEANRLDARFEALNGGREGINSSDIASIVREELLPLDPDLAVYYEGANQFTSATALVSPHIPPRQQIDSTDPIVRHKVPDFIRTHLAVGDLLDRALNRFSPVGEPVRPHYRLEWPAGVDEQNPDVESRWLPLQLPDIVKDLDSIRNSMDSIGGRMVMCSYVWLAQDGMELSPSRHEHIYRHLNTILWPLRYADIRRLADFQNRVFRRYASARGLDFVDVASNLPQDPNLFVDAIHLTETGERLKAWIVFQQLAPMLRRQIEAGQLPRPRDSRPLPPPASLASHEMSTRCAPTGAMVPVLGAASLDTLERAYPEAIVEPGHPAKVITPAARWAYAARIPLHIPAGLAGPAFLLLRVRVAKGQIGLGVLDRETKQFQVEKDVSPSPGMNGVYVPVPLPDRASELMIRNFAEGGIRSELLIDEVSLVAPPRASR